MAASKKETKKGGKSNITGKCVTHSITHKAAMGGQATVSLAEQLHTAGRFMENPRNWPKG